MIKHGSYKKYRDKIIELIRQSKQIISSRKNKKSSTVSTITADDNIVTDEIEMAENLTNFFTSIGTNLPKKIAPTKKTFTDYLKKPNSENFIITSTTADEIRNLIDNLKSSKCFGP